MIIKAFALTLLTEEDALEMKRELLLFFEKKKATDFPQLAELLRNLNIILNNASN